jgi:hypothetical protein
MPHYHDNKLAMVGLDSDYDVKSYPSPTPAKRKRNSYEDDLTGMSGNMSHVNGGASGQGSPMPFYPDMYHEHTSGYEPPSDFWTTNAFAEAYDSPYGDWFLNDYSSNPLFPVANGTPAAAAAAASSAPVVSSVPAVNNVPAVSSAPVASSAPAAPAVDVDATVKTEDDDEEQVSLSPRGGSEYDESNYDERRPSKARKLNKDGALRKPRQPRPKLLKWDDNDWKNVALGLVWACGENGIQIPFDQASQIVSESCTAGALQQALLKLRGKQISEGFQIPSLRMAWTRKNKNSTSSKSSANVKPSQDGTQKAMPAKRKPTRFAGNQSLIITLKRAYKDADRCHLAVPYVPAVPSSSTPTGSSAQAALSALTANSALNIPSYSGDFMIVTPPATPGGRSTTAPVRVAARLNSHGVWVPEYTLDTSARGIPHGPQLFNTAGRNLLPRGSLDESDLKSQRRRTVIYGSPFNPVHRDPTPPANPPLAPRQPLRQFRSSKARKEFSTMDGTWVQGQLVSPEDMDRNFGWQRDDVGEETEDTCSGSSFPTNPHQFDGAGGAGGSSGLAA